MDYVMDPATGVLSPPVGKNGVQFTLSGVLDSAGNFLPLESAAVVPSYDTSGNMIKETATFGASTWVRTYAYTNGTFAGNSQWVKQP